MTGLDAFNLLLELRTIAGKKDLFDGLVELAAKLHNLSEDDAIAYVSEQCQEMWDNHG